MTDAERLELERLRADLAAREASDRPSAPAAATLRRLLELETLATAPSRPGGQNASAQVGASSDMSEVSESPPTAASGVEPPLRVNSTLLTRDGRVVGNAIVRYVDDEGRVYGLSDYGNAFGPLSPAEVRAWFYVGAVDDTHRNAASPADVEATRNGLRGAGHLDEFLRRRHLRQAVGRVAPERADDADVQATAAAVLGDRLRELEARLDALRDRRGVWSFDGETAAREMGLASAVPAVERMLARAPLGRCVEYMVDHGWTWSDASLDGRVPSAGEMREAVRALAQQVAEVAESVELVERTFGGFTVRRAYSRWSASFTGFGGRRPVWFDEELEGSTEGGAS